MPLSGNADLPLEVLDEALSRESIDRLGIAVSGGGDSVALLHLAAESASRSALPISAVTVDHGLRPESAAEARSVAECCKSLGVDHTTLLWHGWDGVGNLQDQARRARYRLMAEWARAEGVAAIALAHTSDDQAETFLMRLARGAGVDGLSGMAERREAYGIVWLRPLLQVGRQELRDYLSRRDIGWSDDPSNDDRRFDRIKARQALATLAPLGIDARSLSAVASNLRDARSALERQTRSAGESIATIDVGDVVLDRAGLEAQPAEITRRLLVHAIKWVCSAEYGPRGASLADAQVALSNDTDVTLHGCRLLASKSQIRVTREFHAVKDETAAVGALWDRRWRVFGKENKDLTVRALGDEGLRHCPDWRQAGHPRISLLATPALWRGEHLVAAPLAGKAEGWTAELVHPANHFLGTMISH